jgi:hypothetical protein
MKTVFEHIEHVKGKPHHIRKRVAFATAAGVTGLIAFVWLAGSLSAGVFAIGGNSFDQSVGQSGGTTSGSNGNSNLAGVAGALEGASAPAYIEIVDTASSTRPVKKAEQTTLPF